MKEKGVDFDSRNSKTDLTKVVIRRLCWNLGWYMHALINHRAHHNGDVV